LTGSDGAIRTIKVPVHFSFNDLIGQVRSRLGIGNEPISLSYYFVWGQKSKRNTLESEDEWDDLVRVAITNHRRKLSGPHMVVLLYSHQSGYQDQNPKKGKEPKEADIESTTNVTFYGKILAKHKCQSCNQVCYIVKGADGTETHHRVTNQVLSVWAAGCKMGDYGVNDLPSELIHDVVPQTNEQSSMATTDDKKPYQKAAPKPRGINGNTTAPPADPPEPSSAPFSLTMPPLTTGFGWHNHPLFPSSQPQVVIMTPEMLSPLRHALGVPRFAPAPSSPTRLPLLLDTSPKLCDWIPQIDEKTEDPEEHFGPYIASWEKNGIRRVKDIMRHTDDEKLAQWGGCPAGRISVLREYAKYTLSNL
ncbi:hypothetical protein CPB86DRAFT_417051, partial [Serendipita vermifera]